MRIKSVIALIVATMLVGCAGTQRTPTQQEAARKQWNAARANVLYGLGKQQYESANFEAARKTVDDAKAMMPDGAAVLVLSAKLYIEEGQLELASKDLEKARQSDPKNAEADYLSGVVCQRWQKPQDALQFYSMATEKSPQELAYWLARAELLVVLDRPAEALAMLREKAAYFENSAAIRDAVGQLLVQEGRYAEAATVLRQASILAENELQIREHLALALYYAGNHRQAADVFERLLTQDRYAGRGDLWLAMGESQMQTGRLRESRESLQKATELNPSSAPAWLALSKTSMELGDDRRAELSIRKALALDGGNSQAYLLLGYLNLRRSALPEAASAFRKSSQLDPSDPISLCMIGYVLEKQGANAQAMEFYGKALRLRPNDELASMLMAQVRLDE